MIGFFAISITQLFNMQILEQPAYSEKSDENSVKPIYQTAPRGVFFDRNHKVLVGNKPSFTLRITPSTEKNQPLGAGLWTSRRSRAPSCRRGARAPSRLPVRPSP